MLYSMNKGERQKWTNDDSHWESNPGGWSQGP